MMKNGVPLGRSPRLEASYESEIYSLIDKYFALPTFEILGELTATMVEYGQAAALFRMINQWDIELIIAPLAHLGANRTEYLCCIPSLSQGLSWCPVSKPIPSSVAAS
jgi:hypothetical protein